MADGIMKRKTRKSTITERLSKSAIKVGGAGKVVIKRTLLGNLLIILTSFAFVASSLFMMQLDEAVYTVIGIIGIVFFGGGGLLSVIVMMRKPIVIISNEGITVPHGWGENVVTWENIVKIEVVQQRIENTIATTVAPVNTKTTQKYIGIFVFDKQGIVGAGKKSQAITKKLTAWEEVPALIINLSFSFLNVEYIAGVLQEFHNKYKSAS